MKTTATLDPSEGAALANKVNEEESRSEWNDAGESGAINDNGTLPTRVVSSVSQSERYVDVDDDWKNYTISVTAPSDDDLGNKNGMDSNFKRSNILLTKGESGSAVNETIRDDDSMGDKTREREVPSFQPNGDSKSFPLLLSSDAKSVSTRHCLPSSSPPCSSISFKASKLDGDDEDESNKGKKKAANNESEEFKGRYSHQFFAAFAGNFFA